MSVFWVYFSLLILYWLLWLSYRSKQMLDSIFQYLPNHFLSFCFFFKLRRHWAHRSSWKELINILTIWSFLFMPKKYPSIVFFFLICNSEFYNIPQKMSARFITPWLLLHADLNNFLTSYFSCSLLVHWETNGLCISIFHSVSLL